MYQCVVCSSVYHMEAKPWLSLTNTHRLVDVTAQETNVELLLHSHVDPYNSACYYKEPYTRRLIAAQVCTDEQAAEYHRPVRVSELAEFLAAAIIVLHI